MVFVWNVQVMSGKVCFKLSCRAELWIHFVVSHYNGRSPWIHLVFDSLESLVLNGIFVMSGAIALENSNIKNGFRLECSSESGKVCLNVCWRWGLCMYFAVSYATRRSPWIHLGLIPVKTFC